MTVPEKGSGRMLLRADEVAGALAISPRKLWELANRAEIRAVRIGRAVRYDPADLRRWINEPDGLPCAELRGEKPGGASR